MTPLLHNIKVRVLGRNLNDCIDNVITHQKHQIFFMNIYQSTWDIYHLHESFKQSLVPYTDEIDALYKKNGLYKNTSIVDNNNKVTSCNIEG